MSPAKRHTVSMDMVVMKVTGDYCHFLCDFLSSTVVSFFEAVMYVCLCYNKSHYWQFVANQLATIWSVVVYLLVLA